MNFVLINSSILIIGSEEILDGLNLPPPTYSVATRSEIIHHGISVKIREVVF